MPEAITWNLCLGDVLASSCRKEREREKKGGIKIRPTQGGGEERKKLSVQKNLHMVISYPSTDLFNHGNLQIEKE